ncbi:indolepyruvate ferredoxin oxidoreductase family protein [Paraburkholderia tuberum]|uniref:Indolepyruvate ferredoxin oxidoreductase n=1 Tax=Paraburkholderia tuberum TaxID=157910 RepID=A0A1H1KJM3_9BURK|nr:indolepyruvate ferredoxin oxidoreductase family protein [Paraburkholderia tuberum]SDR62272.1 indolepyruvate ferredoxin oxidoreductase [Paraburkholderia tuberum]
MNAPLSDATRKALEVVTLDDKYTLETGHAFMNGVQALVRLPMLQRERDARAGHNTAAFISGYRGSPLGTYDQALWQAKKHLAAHHVVFQPGLNEELAATAVWGSQQLDFDPATRKYDGVFGIWYAKGPGVDRSADALKHANLAGTTPLGGVLAVAGDDHLSKSSTLAHQSDPTLIACGMPVFFPASVQEILDLGLHALAMSRYSGLWAGMKTVQEVIEAASSVVVDAGRVPILLPEDFQMPPGGVHARWPDEPLVQEARLMEVKWPAALAYIRANRLNRNVIEGPRDRFGIIASGKAFSDTRQALADLGLDDALCRTLGIRLHKVSVIWPLEPTGVREFAHGLREILVVEEKRPLIEQQLKDELYHCAPNARPHVIGKYNERDGEHFGGEWSHSNPGANWLLRANADLTPALIAKAIARRLKMLGVPEDVAARMDARIAIIEAKERELVANDGSDGNRLPWFCPGCPHNTSTQVPDGSIAMAGIGCHGMAVWMDRSTTSWSQMGGEGVPWVGQAPFSTRSHMFANLGDGTYNHSGSLAVRQAIAADINITYKILFNSAVAMTGGQPVGGQLDVPAMTRELAAEGTKQIVVVTDEPDRYEGTANLAPGVTVRHRDDLDAVQRELRDVPGVTVIVYDQVCATKKRRERKRGTMADPAKRVIINELVCEGCGDCSVQSNCLAVQPVETEFGRKRRINQDTCNKDFSCVKGFCPSFVTVEGGQLRKPAAAAKAKHTDFPSIPEPVLPTADSAWGIVVAGVGGTGVVTIGQVLGMAAHLEGKGVITQDATGMAQMGGATWSHIQIARDPEALHATKVAVAMADLVIACDAIVGANKTTLATMRQGHTFVALNTHGVPTAEAIRNPDWQSPVDRCMTSISAAVGADHLGMFDAEQVATALLGQSIYTNLLMLGYAWQKGRVPLTRDALMRAIELNAVQVENNKAAFEWGRRCAHDLQAVQASFAAPKVIEFVRKPSITDMVAKRVEFLTAYQNRAYASRYSSFVEKVRAAEAPLASTQLTEAVARYLFKLMAYKDEYEVARLQTAPEFTAKIAAMFEGDYKLVHHLAPPLLAKHNEKGELVKQAFGPWMRRAFRGLARLKGLRGTGLDPFGYTDERRTERALIGEYRACIEELLTALSTHNLTLALEIARLPEEIRGYGHVKARNLAAVRTKWDRLMARWRVGETAGAELERTLNLSAT